MDNSDFEFSKRLMKPNTITEEKCIRLKHTLTRYILTLE